jgi:hypothetical protein
MPCAPTTSECTAGEERVGVMAERRIVGYRQDEEQHWIAELECGHSQHVRHTPPWQVRLWVLTPEGRAGRMGTLLSCRRCDEEKARA